MPLSAELAKKSVQAAVAAIEIYNKPNFSYREEAFALLMTNAWELLLKAKWLLDNDENIEALYTYITNENGEEVAKISRSGNAITLGVTHLAAKLVEDENSGLENGCQLNILALVEIRDNAAHFVVKDIYVGRRVLEIGTASLKNYLLLITEWFQIDLADYNFFLMPISFYHGFEAAEPATRAQYSEQIQKLLTFLDEVESVEINPEASQQIALRLETEFVRGKDAADVAFRYTNDPKAPAIAMREEDVLKNYPLTFSELRDIMRRRYTDFVSNREFHKLRNGLEKENKLSIVRILNPNNPKSSRQRFYNPNILQEFDKHYTRRKNQA